MRFLFHLPMFNTKPPITRSPEEEALIRSLTIRYPPGAASGIASSLWRGRALTDYDFSSDPDSMSFRGDPNEP